VLRHVDVACARSARAGACRPSRAAPGRQVPDVFQIIVKEKGVFTNVTSPSTKAKLRILFEVAPLALLVRRAGSWSPVQPIVCAHTRLQTHRHHCR